MKIIAPSYEIVCPLNGQEGTQLLRNIERYARISHRSEDRQTEDSWRRFIQAVVCEHGDWSVVEHEKATVIFRVDRGVTHELVRHRLFSFTQESTRFVSYGKREIEFVRPEFVEVSLNASNPDTSEYRWFTAMEEAERSYMKLLESGEPPQIARSVLPNATASSIVITGNLRSWRHLFTMRVTQETHPDFKRVTIPLLAEFKQRIPLLYDDIEPNVKQRISMEKAR